MRRAAGAFASAGIEKGDRVAIWAPNSAQWIIAAFGLLTAGRVLVPVNTRFKADEAADLIRRSDAKLHLVEKGFLGVDFAVPDGVPPIDLHSGFLESRDPLERAVSGSDVSDIVYTSGTTGRPKGVMMAHVQTLRHDAKWCDRADLRQGDRYLIVNPFFAIFGYKAGCIASMIRGATIVPVRVFDVDHVLELIERTDYHAPGTAHRLSFVVVRAR
jgi:HIP---CoA ligase